MSRTVRKAILSAGCVVMFAATSIAATKFDHAEYLAPKTEGKKDDHPVKGSLAFDKDKKSVDFLDEKGLSAMITACTTDHVDIAIQTHFPHLKQEISIPLVEVQLEEDRTHDTRDPDRPLRHSRLRLVVNLKRQSWV